VQANTYGSPSTTGGNRESLENLLTILAPEETPYTSMVSKGGSVSATYTEWLADTLRAPKRGGTKEGADAGRGSNKATKRQRFGTYLNRSQEDYGVTDVEEIISKNGGVAATDDLYAEAKAKTLREMKRDMELINCSNQEHQGGDAEMQTRGCFMWLKPTAQTTNPVPADFRPASAQILSGVGTSSPLFTEAQLNGVAKALKRVYGAKRTYQMFSGDTVIETVDNFTRIQPSSTNNRYQVRQDASDYEITMMVRVFESSFARLEIVPNQFLNGDTSGNDDPTAALILNMELWKMMFLENLHTKDLDPEQAGGPRGYAKQVWLNRCNNPKGNGYIVNTLN
jgi:hypothetical protein